MKNRKFVSITVLLVWMFFTSCIGQVKTKWPKDSVMTAVGQLKLVKTQGSNQYQNIHCSLQDKTGDLWFGTTGEGV